LVIRIFHDDTKGLSENGRPFLLGLLPLGLSEKKLATA
jgi:hypothetical protein